jgi:hypothetical protein
MRQIVPFQRFETRKAIWWTDKIGHPGKKMPDNASRNARQGF